MKKTNKILACSAVLCCSGLLLSTLVWASSTAGTESDPLITKSYLDDYVTPQLESGITSDLLGQLDDMTMQLEQELQSLREELDSTFQSNQEKFQLVELSSGQTIILDLGAQIVLRVGSATVTGSYSPALVNVTTGSTIDSGTSLTTNHLYLSTIEGRTITATSGTTKVLVFGGYARG